MNFLCIIIQNTWTLIIGRLGDICLADDTVYIKKTTLHSHNTSAKVYIQMKKVCHQVHFSADLGEEGSDFSSCPYTRNGKHI